MVLGILVTILVAALIGVGVLIGKLTGSKSAWVLWSNAHGSMGLSSTTRWDIVSAFESRRECQQRADEFGKIRREAEEAFDPITRERVNVKEGPIRVSILYSCLPQGVDPRGR